MTCAPSSQKQATYSDFDGKRSERYLHRIIFLAKLDLPSSVPLTGTANQEQTARSGHTSFSKFQQAERHREDVTPRGPGRPKQCHHRAVSRSQRSDCRLGHNCCAISTAPRPQWLGSNGAITSAVWSSSVHSFRMNCVVIQRLLHHRFHLFESNAKPL